MMTWTPDSTHDCRDMSVIFGQDFETNSIFDRVSIHARRDMSVEKPAAFTMMTWTHDSTHDWRDMSVEARHDYEATCLSDRDSIETRRDMSVTKPAAFRATHDDDLDTRLDSRLPGYERHIRPRFRNEFHF